MHMYSLLHTPVNIDSYIHKRMQTRTHACLSTYLHIYRSAYLPLYLPTCPPAYSPACLAACQPNHPAAQVAASRRMRERAPSAPGSLGDLRRCLQAQNHIPVGISGKPFSLGRVEAPRQAGLRRGAAGPPSSTPRWRPP